MTTATGTSRAVLRSVAAAATIINVNAIAFSHQVRRQPHLSRSTSNMRTSANGITTTSIVVAARPCSVGPTTDTRPSLPSSGWMLVGDGATVAIGLRIAALQL